MKRELIVMIIREREGGKGGAIPSGVVSEEPRQTDLTKTNNRGTGNSLFDDDTVSFYSTRGVSKRSQPQPTSSTAILSPL